MMAPRTLLLSSAVRNLQGKGPCSWSRCLSAASTSAASNDPQQRVETKIDENGIASVELARPEKLNGLDLEMFEALGATAASLRSDKSLRGVILSGQGRGFCAGLDVTSIVKNNPIKTFHRLLERPSGYGRTADSAGNLAQDVAYLWRDLPVPVIAVLHGMCFGGGLQIALGADFRFATPDCKISIMEAKWGLIPDMSASVTLRELVRIDVAKELTMTGRIIDGQEAASLGLVTRCVDDPMKEAESLAAEIVGRSPDAVAKAKELFQQTQALSEEECLKIESELQCELIPSSNQLIASAKSQGWNINYFNRSDK